MEIQTIEGLSQHIMTANYNDSSVGAVTIVTNTVQIVDADEQHGVSEQNNLPAHLEFLLWDIFLYSTPPYSPDSYTSTAN